MLTLAALAFAGTLASGPVAPSAAVQDPPLTADQSITCAAVFYAYSTVEPDPDTVKAFEEGTGFFIVRAERVGQGLTSDQILDRATTESLALTALVEALPDAQAKIDLIWNHGPGMDRCIDVALAEN